MITREIPMQPRTAAMYAFWLLCIVGMPALCVARGDDEPKSRPRVYGRVVALCIGMEQYLSPTIDKVPYAINDAKKVAEILADRYGFETETLIGSKATRAAILEKTRALASSLGANDALLFFFAGHGQIIEQQNHKRTGFLVPYDAELDLASDSDLEKWGKQAIEMRELGDLLSKSKARHVLIMLDACCSGFMAKRGNFIERPDLQELAALPSRMVVAASTDNQAAFSSTKSDHGIFTDSLLKQLASSEAQSTNEIFLEIRKQVAIDSKRTMIPQLGKLTFDDGEFIFVPLTIKESEIKEAMTTVNARMMHRRGAGTTIANVIEAFEASDFRHSSERPTLEKSWKVRTERFEKNGASGDPLALAAMTLSYTKGLGLETSPRDALKAAKLAYETEHAAGVFALAHCLAFGIGTERNPEAARSLLEQPGLKSFPLNDLLLAELLLLRNAASRPEALKLLDRAAKAGVPTAKVRLIELQLGIDGGGVTFYTDPISELLPLAEAGNQRAGYLIYLLTIRKNDVSQKDSELALKYLTKAASGGYLHAQYALAVEYYRLEWFQGRLDVKPDFVEARRWATLAADRGHAKAHQMLAMIYKMGQGIEADGAKGQFHHDKAQDLKPDNMAQMAIWWLKHAIK